MDTETGSLINDLASLTFEQTADVSYKDLTYLRKRSHACTLHLIAHASYFVATLNEIRRKIDQKINDENDVLLSTGFDAYNSYNRLKIGIIGCGRLGSHLLNALLLFSNVDSSDVMISTCRPELLPEDIKSGDAHCCWDNTKVAEVSELLFLCVPPSQAEEVFQEIKGHAKGFVYSFIAGFSASKVSLEINSMKVFKPVYSFSKMEVLEETEYDFQGVLSTLPLMEFREHSCPLRTESTNTLVAIDNKFVEVLFFEGLNNCLQSLKPDESFNIVKDVMFPNTKVNRELCSAIYKHEFFKDGRFDILGSQTSNTELTPIFQNASHEWFMVARIRYKSVFDRFYDWRIPKS